MRCQQLFDNLSVSFRGGVRRHFFWSGCVLGAGWREQEVSHSSANQHPLHTASGDKDRLVCCDFLCWALSLSLLWVKLSVHLCLGSSRRAGRKKAITAKSDFRMVNKKRYPYTPQPLGYPSTLKNTITAIQLSHSRGGVVAFFQDSSEDESLMMSRMSPPFFIVSSLLSPQLGIMYPRRRSTA